MTGKSGCDGERLKWEGGNTSGGFSISWGKMGSGQVEGFRKRSKMSSISVIRDLKIGGLFWLLEEEIEWVIKLGGVSGERSGAS